MNIEAIREAADREVSSSPHDRTMPPDTWDYSQQLRDQLNAYIDARTQHADAWGDLNTAVTDLDEAAAADELARRHAARDGKKDPGTAATEKAASALQFATYRAQELRRAADSTFPDTLIATEIASRQAEFASQLVARINEATSAYQNAVSQAQAQVTRAERKLDRIRDELNWSRDKFKGLTIGTIGAPYEQTRWPGPAARRTDNWIKTLSFVADHATIAKATVGNSFDATYPDGSKPGD